MIGDNHQIRQHKIFRWMLVILLATGFGVTIGFGKKVSLTEIPAVVQDTIVREIGQALIDKIDRDKDDDGIVYEVDAEGDGIDIELQVEEEIPLSKLPQVVHDTVTREIRNLWIEEVRCKTRLGGRVSYEIEASGEGKEIDLEVAADGWLLYKKIDDSDIAFIFPHQLEMLSENGLDLILAIDCIHEIDKSTIQYYFKFNKYPESFFVD